MSTDGSRPATPDDVDAICLGLPEVELGISWGDRPTYKVPTGDRGRGFLLYRMPHKSAVDPETGEMDDATPFFTIDHFKSFNAVLVQQSRLGELTHDELAEIIAEAWVCRAPKKLVKQHFGDG